MQKGGVIKPWRFPAEVGQSLEEGTCCTCTEAEGFLTEGGSLHTTISDELPPPEEERLQQSTESEVGSGTLPPLVSEMILVCSKQEHSEMFGLKLVQMNQSVQGWQMGLEWLGRDGTLNHRWTGGERAGSSSADWQ